jgi:hypothetical protein
VTSFDSTTTPSVLPVAAFTRELPALEPRLPALELLGPEAETAARSRVETRIAATFAQRYGATIDHFLPYLLCLSASQQLGAVAGLRLARESALFLEQYLDAPVEQAVSREFRTPVDRAQIVEIGNLASAVNGSAALLFALLPAILDAAGMRWVVCTATPQVLAMLGKLQFPTRTICAADPQLLEEGMDNWGSYYSSRPQVIVGDVRVAARRAENNRATAMLQRALDAPVRRIAAALKNAG